jgi:hypothetical protein
MGVLTFFAVVTGLTGEPRGLTIEWADRRLIRRWSRDGECQDRR